MSLSNLPPLSTAERKELRALRQRRFTREELAEQYAEEGLTGALPPIDPELMNWFSQFGKKSAAHINAALRLYMQAHQQDAR